MVFYNMSEVLYVFSKSRLGSKVIFEYAYSNTDEYKGTVFRVLEK